MTAGTPRPDSQAERTRKADEELLRELREAIRASGESDEVRLFSPFAELVADALERRLSGSLL